MNILFWFQWSLIVMVQSVTKLMFRLVIRLQLPDRGTSQWPNIHALKRIWVDPQDVCSTTQEQLAWSKVLDTQAVTQLRQHLYLPLTYKIRIMPHVFDVERVIVISVGQHGILLQLQALLDSAHLRILQTVVQKLAPTVAEIILR